LKSEQKGSLTSQEYLDALAANHRLSRAEGIDFIMDNSNSTRSSHPPEARLDHRSD